MKKNITINLCGRLFQIDEDAYELLQQYIESLRSSFGKQEGGEEIVDDIEARIAELFDELRQQGIEAITIDHVKDIITRIGKPEELAGNENENQNDGKEGHHYDSFHTAANGFREHIRARTKGKRLFRNPNDKMLAGVLSGFATYTGTDATWWRIGYALLFLCSNFFIFPIFKLFHLGGFFFHVNLAFVVFYLVLAIATTRSTRLPRISVRSSVPGRQASASSAIPTTRCWQVCSLALPSILVPMPPGGASAMPCCCWVPTSSCSRCSGCSTWEVSPSPST